MYMVLLYQMRSVLCTNNVRMFVHSDRTSAGAEAGGWGGGLRVSVELPFDTKFHFHWKVWIKLMNVGYPSPFTLYFSSASPFKYL